MPSIFEKYDLKQVINTSGRMTILGVSTPRPEVVDAAMAGMNQYFEMKDLVNKTGAYIAKLMDDRKERPGVMFADMELIGIPHTIVLGDRNLDNDDIEYKYRRSGEKQLIKTGDIVNYLVQQIKG